MSENPTEEVRFKASLELIQQLQDWSKPVQIRISPAPGGYWDMEVRDPFGTLIEAIAEVR